MNGKEEVPKFSGLYQASPSPFKGPPACVNPPLVAQSLPRFSFLGFSFVHDSPGVPDKLNEGLLCSSLVFDCSAGQIRHWTGDLYIYYCMYAGASPGVWWPLMLFLPWAFFPHPAYPGWSCDRHPDSTTELCCQQ